MKPLLLHRYTDSLAGTSAEPKCLTCSQDDWELPPSELWTFFHDTTCQFRSSIFVLGPHPVIPESCDFFRASCDEQLEYCLLFCDGPAIPFTVLAQFNKDSEKFVDLQFLETNEEQRGAVAELELPSMQTFTVPEDNGKYYCIHIMYVHFCLLYTSDAADE